VDVDHVIDDLYGLSPGEFTAARDARAAEARKSGDRAAAESLKKLRKPSAGAWLSNQLARQRSKDVENLITLGGKLRAAQDRLDGEKIRRLSKARNEAIASLLREARSLAAQSGAAVSEAAAEDLEATLNAALVDPEAAEAVRRGRLTGALRYSGLGSASAASDVRAVGSAGPKGNRDRRKPDLSSARDAVALAQRELEKANRAVERARADVEERRRSVLAAEAKLKAARSAADLAAGRVKAAQKSAATAKKGVDAARRALRTRA
jgi:hypothetical protein